MTSSVREYLRLTRDIRDAARSENLTELHRLITARQKVVPLVVEAADEIPEWARRKLVEAQADAQASLRDLKLKIEVDLERVR